MFSGTQKISLLDLSNNLIEDIGNIENISDIRSLVLSNNKIKDIESLKKIKNVLSLTLKNCDVSDISALKEMKLMTLDVSDNPNVKGYSNFDTLYSITLNNCDLNNDSEIFDMNNLSSISLENNNITSINPDYIKNSKGAYVYLNLQGNNIENIGQIYNLKENFNIIYDKEIEIRENMELPSAEKVILYTKKINNDIKDKYSKYNIPTENCSFENGSIIMDTSDHKDDTASLVFNLGNVKIKYIIEYKVKDDIEPISITPAFTNNKQYQVGSKIDKSDIILRVNYNSQDNYSYYAYTNNFNLLQESLKAGNNDVFVGYGSLTNSELKVYAFDDNDLDNKEFKQLYFFTYFLDKVGYDNVYKVDYDNLSIYLNNNSYNNIEFLEIYDAKNATIKDWEKFSNIKQIYYFGKYEKIDSSVLNNFSNLQEVILSDTKVDNLEEILNSKYKVKFISDYVSKELYGFEGSKIYLPNYVKKILDDESYALEACITDSNNDRLNYKLDIQYDEEKSKPYVDIEKYKNNNDEVVILKINKQEVLDYYLSINISDLK